MSRRGRVALAAAAALALGAALVALALGFRDEGASENAPPVVARVVVSPRNVLFGDIVVARVEVALDRRRADPESLRVQAAFEPWTIVGAPVRTRRDGERATSIELRYRLRCHGPDCVPAGRPAEHEFRRARIEYADPDGVDHSFSVRWPVVVTSSRLVSADFGREDEYGTPWRADLRTLPAVSYRLPPALLLALLAGGAALLAAAGAAFAYAALPAPRVEPEPEPEPEPPPPDLTPLERALELLEAPRPANGAAGRRRALELVADELHARDAALATSVRTLAWAEGQPAAAQARSLAERVRTMLEAERARIAPVLPEENGASQA